MGGTGVATLAPSRAVSAATTVKGPKGLGLASGLPGALTPGCGTGLGGPPIRRQWTMAKRAPRETACQALPFLLDISLALFENMDMVKSSVDSEVVFQATLQVPAHHALSCRMQAYGTPFAAPDLQAAADALSDADLEFAACIAAPPDLDEQLSMNLGRVMSMLEQNRAELNQIARGGGGAQQAGTAPAQQAAAPAAAQLRAAPGAGQQTAPRVLVSVDDAEAGSAQITRTNSAKKPRLGAAVDSMAKRATQALLGFGYLLTVLHEKHLGGRIQFSAAALTPAVGTPGADSHLRRRSSSAGRSGRSGLLAAQPVQRDRAAGGAARDGSFDMVWERISAPSSPTRPVAGLALSLSLSAPVAHSPSAGLQSLAEEGPGGGEALSKDEELRRSGSMQAALDAALQQLAEVDPAAAAAASGLPAPAPAGAPRSHGLADQGPLTSPAPPGRAAASWAGAALPPLSPLATGRGAGAPAASPPKWQFEEGSGLEAPGAQGGAPATPPQAARAPAPPRRAVNVRDEWGGAAPPSGLWPTMSFSLVPVRLTPAGLPSGPGGAAALAGAGRA
ncbi:hypothetical protein HT031_003580 [Scenedesmus sp. PABB004]|nr:hypothetical protein HT031_003580 [Scenedesmus sp. PABB004]